MIEANWMAMLTLGLLWSATSLAYDLQSSETRGKLLPAETLSVETLFAESAHPSRWRPARPAQATLYSDEWLRPIDDFNFQDEGTLSRVGKLRSLSLLTLVEFRQTRLFLGVNEDGLVGLHFDVFPYHHRERYLELARMPYLKKPLPEAK